MRHQIEIVNPVAGISEGGIETSQTKSIGTLDNLRIGLLDNHMPHAGEFLQHMGEALSERCQASITHWQKAYSAQSAGNEMLDEIAEASDAVVTGFGV
jgi:hypothetical protein